LIIGYRRGYRSSWATTLGSVTQDVFSDNESAWSADHCMATEELPGVLFCNRVINHSHPTLIDLAPTILKQFNLLVPPDLRGTGLLRRS
jgi:hypothetical protein